MPGGIATTTWRLLQPHAVAVAVAARVHDQLAAPAALGARAGAHHLAEHGAHDLPHLPHAVARRAGDRVGAGLGARLLAALARRVHLGLDLGAHPEGGVVERDGGLRGRVGARPAGRRAAAPAAAEAEHVLAEQHREQVAEVAGLERGVGLRVASLDARVPVAVVATARVGVGQHLVRLGHLAEALGRRRIVLVDVGVQLAREAPEGLLDLVVGCVARDSERVVVVALRRHPRSHGSRTSTRRRRLRTPTALRRRSGPRRWPSA